MEDALAVDAEALGIGEFFEPRRLLWVGGAVDEDEAVGGCGNPERAVGVLVEAAQFAGRAGPLALGDLGLALAAPRCEAVEVRGVVADGTAGRGR